MDSSLDLTAALARLRALIDDDPRAALERALRSDPLRLAPLARRKILARGALVLVDAVVVGTYAKLLESSALERLTIASIEEHVTAALVAAERAPFAPELLDALERALGCNARHVQRAAELIRELGDEERPHLLNLLRERSEALARLWNDESALMPGSDTRPASDRSATLLRRILAAAFRA
jgi:hypothetical protein